MKSTDIILVQMRRVPVSPRGNRVNEASHLCRYSDAVVARARAMRASGARYSEISAALGVSRNTAQSWALGRKRPIPARYKLVPVSTADCTQ